MNSYQKVKTHILEKLQKVQDERGILNLNDIDSEINNIKILLSIIEAKNALFGKDEIALSNRDFLRIKRELETDFDVKMEIGLLIQGDIQQERDTTWWTGDIQQGVDNYYWNRYKNYLKRKFPSNVIRAIDVDTDIIMNNIDNPRRKNFSRYGMVVGHVQSGKTSNYSSLICKAGDAGYKFIVVVAGGINNLRNQTQGRINEAFIGKDRGKQVGVGVGNSRLDREPKSLTTIERDFNKHDADRNAQGTNFETHTTPILIVVKKNTKTLTSVISWLESVYNKNRISNHAILMIDDESDYASINTKGVDNPTAINKKLRQLLALFHKSTYIAYTATPYANIFIDHEAGHDDLGRDLFPKDFIYALNAPNNYFGARRVFLDKQRKFVVPIDDYLDDIPSNHSKDFDLHSIPESLYDAIRLFVLNVAIRDLRGQGSSHNSMLIHATIYTAIHQKFALHVDSYLFDIRVEIHSYGRLARAERYSSLIKLLKKTFELRYLKIEFGWSEVLAKVCLIIDSIVVREVHQKTSIPLEYRKDRPTNAIVIGGTSLSRGYTIEGLSVSYFIRNTLFYDTLMQMGRWFGYHIGYEDICKVYMPESMIDNFSRIIEATEDLVKDFKLMSEANRVPSDFGLAVKQHPDSLLQVTARNKQRNVQNFIFNMRLDGRAKETSWLSNDIEEREKNLSVIEHMVKGLQKSYELEQVGSSLFWRGVDKKMVIAFLEDFYLYQTDALGIGARMPISFVKKYVLERDTLWDVAIYSGNGERYTIGDIQFYKEIRQATLKNNYIEIKSRQISTPNSEAITLSSELREEIGENRKEIRKHLKRPLLQLHILQTNIDKQLASFGISFPGDILSGDETISMKINTVYARNLLEELETISDD